MNVPVLQFSVSDIYLFFHGGDDVALVVTNNYTPGADGDLVVLAVVLQLSPLVERAVLG